VPFQSRSHSFVPLDQRSENESSGSIPFEITKANNRILVIRLSTQSQTASMECNGACLKWMLPELWTRALVFRPLVKGNEALGTRMVPPVTARDEPWPFFHFWRHHFWSKLASSILSRRKRSFQWCLAHSDRPLGAWNTHKIAQKDERLKTQSQISCHYT